MPAQGGTLAAVVTHVAHGHIRRRVQVQRHGRSGLARVAHDVQPGVRTLLLGVRAQTELLTLKTLLLVVIKALLLEVPPNLALRHALAFREAELGVQARVLRVPAIAPHLSA